MDPTPRLELSELEAFVAIARAGSFSRAAVELDIVQPSLSRLLRRLETKLGAVLLERHSRGVRISPAGAVLLDRAEAMLDLLRQATEELHRGGDPARGTVTLGLPLATVALLAPLVIARFKTAWPNATLSVSFAASSTLESNVLDRRLDIAAVYDPMAADVLEVTPLATESLVVVCPPTQAAGSASDGVRLRDLAQIPLILPSLEYEVRRVLTQTAMRYGVKLTPAFEIDNIETAKAMVRRGLGFALLPYAAVQEEVTRGALLIRTIERPALSMDLTLIALPDSDARPLLASVARLVAETTRELVTAGQWGMATLVKTRP